MAEAAVVVTSELVTNAVQASTGPDGRPLYLNGRMAGVWVKLFSDGTRLVVEVWDQAPGYPQPRSAGADNTDGRGLRLVEGLTGKQWGWEPARGGRAVKCVWAMVRPAAAEMIAQPGGAGFPEATTAPSGVADTNKVRAAAVTRRSGAIGSPRLLEATGR